MNRIDPSATIRDEVVLGDGNFIGAGTVLEGPIEIGDNNYIAGGVRIGGPSRERLHAHHRLGDPIEPAAAWVRIGSDCTIFENVVVHKPMLAETIVGDRVELGAAGVVAHDCVIRADAVLSPRTALGAYVTIGAGANLGLGTNVHNRVAVGAYAMCGLASAVVGHVPPAALVYGNPARLAGVNRVGLSRAGLDDLVIGAAEKALRSPVTNGYPKELESYFKEYLEDQSRWPTSKVAVKWNL